MSENSNRQLFLVVLVCGIGLTYFFLFGLPQPVSHEERVFQGFLYASDAGEAKGGFEYTATWNATMKIEDSEGVLNFELKIGLGDALEKHVYRVTDFQMSEEELSMKLEGQPVEMMWVEEDEIWNGEFNEYYIASWGGYAPPEEIRGTISADLFKGFAQHYYVELRLKPAET